MLDTNNRSIKIKTNGFSGHFFNEPDSIPIFSDSDLDYLQFKLLNVVTQDFVDKFFVKCYHRENINRTTPKQLIDNLFIESRQTGKPELHSLMINRFIVMVNSYIKSNKLSWFETITGATTIVSLDTHIVTTGVPSDAVNKNGSERKKAKFKQSKFDQINSFGKRN